MEEEVEYARLRMEQHWRRRQRQRLRRSARNAGSYRFPLAHIAPTIVVVERLPSRAYILEEYSN